MGKLVLYLPDGTIHDIPLDKERVSMAAIDKFVNAVERHLQVARKARLIDAGRLEELLAQDLARMNRGQLRTRHKALLVIIRNLDIIRVALTPAKADAPLIVDANAVFTRSTP